MMNHDEDLNFKKLEEASLLVLRKFVMAYTKPPEAKEARISTSQYLILEILRNEGSKSSSELAQFFKITLPAITNLSKKLVEGGYIERVHSESDRRLILLHITSKGLAYLSVMDETGKDIIRTLWSDLSSEEVKQLNSIFQKALQRGNKYE
ncbi:MULTISPECIES: MarR family winged helix-turn-helix transcriptional regulator [Bacillus cereus group]|uniref:MarR family winged helix-turn-helix transcriptional regulator n=2 Tax=Bacillaceae TaxID=186817 RepID=UPI00103C6306|nr:MULTISPECIES: MarR family transcriptional regulator [Bacillus cereus group]MBJ7959201.1 MarR family transcriptional regulator [Bacillus cereus group sp. N28]MCU4830765.1 MarR family transcriptional regulator [Bacillus toyonensis]TBX73752.1 MarR family transcriptional regulator [Bacillus mycoides]WJE23208.1 MarR family transcriptional regulator [Bacillus cereus]